MSDLKNIAGQSSIFLLGTLFTVVVGFFFKIYIARELGAIGLGIYSLGISLLAVISVFVSLGLGNGLVKYVSKYVAEKNLIQLQTYLHFTFRYSFIATITVGVLIFLFPKIIGETILNSPEIVPFLPFFAILLFLNTTISLLDQTIRGLKQVKKSTVIGNFLRQPAKIGLAIFLISLGWQLRGYLYAEIFAASICLILFYRITKKYLPDGIQSLFALPKSQIKNDEKKFGINFMIIGGIGILTVEADKLLLANYFSISELGIYSVILTFTAFIPIVLNSVISIFGPLISEKYALSQMSEMASLVKQTTYYIFLASFTLIFTIAFGGKVLLDIFGDEYIVGFVPLMIILIGHVFNIITGAVGTVLIMTGNDIEIRNMQIASFALSIILFIILIPSFGIIGAAIVKMLVLIITNAYLTYKMYVINRIMVFDRQYLKLIVFSLIFLTTAILIKQVFGMQSNLTVIISLFLFLVIFYALWFWLFSKTEERNLILNYVNKRFLKDGE